MQVKNVRIWMTALFMLSHFASIIMVIAFISMGGFVMDEGKALIAFVGTAVVVYSTRMFSDVMNEKNSARKISKGKASVSLGIVVLFVVSFPALIYFQAYRQLRFSFEDFLIILAVVQTMLGCYLTVIVNSFFTPASVTEHSLSGK